VATCSLIEAAHWREEGVEERGRSWMSDQVVGHHPLTWNVQAACADVIAIGGDKEGGRTKEFPERNVDGLRMCCSRVRIKACSCSSF